MDERTDENPYIELTGDVLLIAIDHNTKIRFNLTKDPEEQDEEVLEKLIELLK